MDAVDNALREFADLVGLPKLAFDAQGQAALEFDEDFRINLYREDADTLELWAHVPGFGPVTDPVILRHALEGNRVNGMTGGARLALEPDATQFMLCERLRVRGMTAAQLQGLLHSFLAILAYWNSPDAMPDRLSPATDEADAEPQPDDAVLIRL